MHTHKILLLPSLALGLLFLANCSPRTGKSTAGSTKPELHYSAAQIAEGQVIFTSHCGKCHQLYQPEEKSVAKWNAVLPPMIKKAKLSDEQGELVRAYVMANVKD
jgi:mono/diheme cytochrome c family protein